MTKYCPHCHRLLRLSAFHRKASTWDGRQVWCKACVRVYQRQRETPGRTGIPRGGTTGSRQRCGRRRPGRVRRWLRLWRVLA